MPKSKKNTKDYALTNNQCAPNYFAGNPFEETRDHLAMVGARVEWLRDFHEAWGSPAEELAEWSPSLEKLDKALHEFIKVLSKLEFKDRRKELEELKELKEVREYTKELDELEELEGFREYTKELEEILWERDLDPIL